MRLIRTDGGGDSKRVKFVLLSWTGESAGVMAKARLTEHRAWLDAHLRPTHVTLALTERAALATLDGAQTSVFCSQRLWCFVCDAPPLQLPPNS